jgi:TIR domain
MSLDNKKLEIERLIKTFELEADKYHNIEFHAYLINSEGKSEIERKFRQPCHAIMLWQYIGQLGIENVLNEFVKNLNASDLKWGIRGAQLTKYGVIEGAATNQFVRMAKRAGALFSAEEATSFKSRVINEIQAEALKSNPKSLPTVAVNDNPLAIWLNYLLFYVSKTYPSRELSVKIEPDLFTLSLLALEQIADELTIGKSDKSITQLSEIRFKVALSFPGEKRRYVSRVVDILRKELPKDSVFYDLDYQAQIARPNADILLQNIYHKQSELIVVFISKDYSKKEWCGLEWRAIRDLIKSKNDEKIMFVNFDNAKVDGMFSIDGYIDGTKYKAELVAFFILERLKTLKK